MERRIGNKILYQRTDYSKPRLFSAITGKDITEKYLEEIDEIMSCYKEQTSNPTKYFGIHDNAIVGIAEKYSNLKYLFVPDGIKVIEKEGLRDSTYKHLSLPDSLEKIKDIAFSGCIFLEDIYIPDSVSSIGYCAFSACESLEYIHLPKGLNKIARGCFRECGSLRYIDIPDSVKIIEQSAFSGCINLENIQLSKNLEYLCENVFAGCSELKYINLPYGLKRIDQECFVDCIKLKEICIPDSVTNIYSQCFSGCTSLESVSLSNNLLEITSKTFNDCKSLKEIVLPDTIRGIGSFAFLDAKDLENINLPKNLDFIHIGPFSYSGIKSITINHDLINLKAGQNDLTNKSNIYKLIISNNVKKITVDAFKFTGSHIKEIEYLGSKEQFEEFKNNNRSLFDCCLTCANKITYIDKNKDEYLHDIQKEH